MPRAQKTTGFTLLEIAIVIVIIGLLAGGVLVGRDLIETAKINSQITQIQKYATAVNAFRGKYGSLPGDISIAKAASFGFEPRGGETHAGYYSESGNGDGNISYCFQNRPEEGDEHPSQGCETLLFWRDLSDAHMLDAGFNTAIDDDIGYPTSLQGLHPNNMPKAFWPRYIPPGKLDDSWVMVYNHYQSGCGQFGVRCPPANTNLFILSGILRINGKNVSIRYTITPRIASRIDAKMDDGYPQAGNVRGYSIRPDLITNGLYTFIQGTEGSSRCGHDDWDAATNTIKTISGRYNVQNTQPLCVMAFAF